MVRQMAVSPSRRQFVPPAVSKWQSLSSEDSLLTFYHNKVSKWQSLSSEDSLLTFYHNKVSKWQSLSSEDSLLTFYHSSQQMAVSFSRRQFAHFLTAGSTNGSLS